MALELLTSLMMTCPTPLIINLSTDPWNKHDRKVYGVANYRCRTEYKSCLRKFIKKESLVFNAICGKS